MEISIIEEIRSLIGNPPAGLEFMEYVYAGFLLCFLTYSAVSLIASIFKWIGGGS